VLDCDFLSLFELVLGLDSVSFNVRLGFCFVLGLVLVLGLLGLVSLRVRFIFQVSSGVTFGYSYFKLVLALDLVSLRVRLKIFLFKLVLVLDLVSLKVRLGFCFVLC